MKKEAGIDKEKVIKKFTECFEERFQSMGSSLADIREAMREAPGSNIEHLDTSKFDLNNISVALNNEVLRVGEALDYFKSLPVMQKNKTVTHGSLVTLCDPEDNDWYYSLVEKGGGETIEIEGIPISSLSLTAPLARACLGKQAGDQMQCNGRKYKIVEVR
jgi:transcription elongation GreA/GreB family factor